MLSFQIRLRSHRSAHPAEATWDATVGIFYASGSPGPARPCIVQGSSGISFRISCSPLLPCGGHLSVLPRNRKLRAIRSIDALKPFKLPWSESKLHLRLLVRSAAQLRCIVNDIWTTGLNCRFVTYVGWWRCSNEIGKCWQPDSQRDGIVVDNVVHAWAYFQGCNRCRGGIFDMNK